MKIALAIESLRVSRGGAERFTVNLARGLLARGHQVGVLCTEWDDAAGGLGAEMIRVTPPGPGWKALSDAVHDVYRGHGGFDLLFGLTQICPQDVHRLGGGVYRYWFRRKYGAAFPLVRALPRVRRRLAFERRLYAPGNLRHAIAISEMDRRLLQEYYTFPAERIHRVYNGIDMDNFHARDRAEARKRLCARHEISPDSRIVLFAANNDARKGLAEAVEALCRAKRPGAYTLVVIGRGRRRIRSRLARRARGRVAVRWCDAVSSPADYYRGADLMLFPTHYDSFANVIGEALCCGLPVITTAQAGGAEMITPGVNGYIAGRAEQVDELAGYLNSLIDRDVCNAFSERTRDKVGECTLDKCAEETEKVLLLAHNDKVSRSV